MVVFVYIQGLGVVLHSSADNQTVESFLIQSDVLVTSMSSLFLSVVVYMFENALISLEEFGNWIFRPAQEIGQVGLTG